MIKLTEENEERLTGRSIEGDYFNERLKNARYTIPVMLDEEATPLYVIIAKELEKIYEDTQFIVESIKKKDGKIERSEYIDGEGRKISVIEDKEIGQTSDSNNSIGLSKEVMDIKLEELANYREKKNRSLVLSGKQIAYGNAMAAQIEAQVSEDGEWNLGDYWTKDVEKVIPSNIVGELRNYIVSLLR